MDSKGFLKILKKGVREWNRWRNENPNIKIDLSQADLSRFHLMKANLSEANLIRANLVGANLRKANLEGANLWLANLIGVNLYGGNLIGANLIGAILRKARLKEANFSRVFIGNTDFGEVDLSGCIGLETIYSSNPSHLNVDTFQFSKGKFPEKFLRGCGLSDWEVESTKLYQPELSAKEVNDILHRVYDFRTNQAIQITPLFISYSHQDSTFVDKMEKHLDAKGIRFWRDIHDATAGRLEKVIDRAMRQNPTVLLVLSENSVQSDWVEHEARSARELEKELKQDVLCPVALDGAWKDCPWPERLREQIMEYNILDFSNWKDESEFTRKFAKLVEGLDLFYKE